jgi:hypothetical protein
MNKLLAVETVIEKLGDNRTVNLTADEMGDNWKALYLVAVRLMLARQGIVLDFLKGDSINVTRVA